MASDVPRPAARRAARHRRHPVLAGFAVALLAVVVFVGSTAAGLLAAPVDFTPPAPPRPALILDRNGKLIGEIASPQQRIEVPAAQIPDVMRNAVVAAEDKSFYSNSGVDPLAIVRAAISDLTGGSSQGGSTITQQYVKNVFVGDQHSFARKLKEAALSIRLDQRLSKQEILTRYLNEVYFGQGTYGVQAAAQYYFGVDASRLTLSQASLLAGIIPAPSDYNPVTSLAKARVRQKYVLNRMVDSGYLDTDTASAAYEAVPRIVGHPLAAAATTSIAPQFVAEVAAQIKAKYATNQDLLYRGGLAVRTTLDVDWQQAANAALVAVLPKATDPEAAVVVMDTRDGSILGQAEKVDAGQSQFDLARLASRISGSSVKPFTLATALENGATLNTTVYGPRSKTYPTSVCPAAKDGKPYTITNDEGGGGTYTLTRALAESVNTVYGPLAVTLGTAKVAAVAKAAGFTDLDGTVKTNCAMGLGVAVTPLNEAVGYSTLADGGVNHGYRDVLSVSARVGPTGAGGTVISRTSVPARRAIPADVAGQVQQAMRAVVAYGTATRARQPDGLDVYGKTGTTDDFTNAWFTGCVPAYHVCVTTWMGYNKITKPDGSPHTMVNVEGTYHVAGGTLPAKIFAKIMDGYRSRATPPTPTASVTPPPFTPRTTVVASRTPPPSVIATSPPPATLPTRTRSSTAPTRTVTSSSAPPSTSATVSTSPSP